MKFSVAAITAFATAALAIPQWGNWGCPQDQCISQDDANRLVDRFISVLGHYDSDIGDAATTANAILADSYREISDSILSLEGLPLGQVTFDGKQGYIAGVLGAPPVLGAQTNAVLVSCPNKVVWYWNFTQIGSAQYPVKGFNYFELNEQQQITTAYLEFNSVAWGLDTGYQIIFPQQQ